MAFLDEAFEAANEFMEYEMVNEQNYDQDNSEEFEEDEDTDTDEE